MFKYLDNVIFTIKNLCYNMFNNEEKELDSCISNSLFDMDILNKVNNILSSSKTIYQKEYTKRIIEEFIKSRNLTEETINILNAYVTVLNFEINYYYFELNSYNKKD